MTCSGNAISYHKSCRLTDKDTLTQAWLCALLSLCVRVRVWVCVWLTFPKAQQIRAEQVPIDLLVENRELKAAVHSPHTLLR